MLYSLLSCYSAGDSTVSMAVDPTSANERRDLIASVVGAEVC